MRLRLGCRDWQARDRGGNLQPPLLACSPPAGECRWIAFQLVGTHPLAAAEDLVAIETDEDGVETTRTCTLTPTLDGNGRITGGTAVTSVAIPVTSTVLFKRVTPKVQSTDIVQGSRLSAEALESSLDRQMMILQEIARDYAAADAVLTAADVAIDVRLDDLEA